MGHYIKQEVDFIVRTRDIIRQYDQFIKEPEISYNVTLFINCMIGLLIIPQQHWYGQLPVQDVSEDDWGIGIGMISLADKGNGVHEVARHLRNSLAHYRFTSLPGDKDYLNSFEFVDKLPNGTETFRAIIPVPALKKFVHKLAENFLSAMEREK